MQPSRQVPEWNGARTAEAIRAALPGVDVQWLREVGSTSSELKRQIAARPDLPKLLFTDYQTEGRGRLGRHWIQPGRARDMALSLALPMPDWAAGEPRLSLLCGATAALAVEQQAGVSVGLKWPNDLELNCANGWKKVGGILAEVTPAPGGAQWIVLGIGLNVNSSGPDFPQESQAALCTLRDAAGEQDLGAIHKAVAATLYGLLSSGQPDIMQLMHEWLRRDATGRCRYLLHEADELLEVMAIGVDEERGALRCVDEDGNLFNVTSHSALERLP